MARSSKKRAAATYLRRSVGHVDAENHPLQRPCCHETGRLKRLGRVDHQDAFLDTHSLERARGHYHLQAGPAASRDPGSHPLDTPGHVDFSAEMERTLQVLDYAILVISGTDGVQAHIETPGQLLRRYHIPYLSLSQ